MGFLTSAYKKRFEKKIGQKNTDLVVLKNQRGMEVALSDYGARIVSLIVPDKLGKLVDVVLGFDSIDGYLDAQESYYGVTVGRFANRLANGTFSIDGRSYYVKPNNGINALHGGTHGFHTRVWDRRVYSPYEVQFCYVSKDGEEGFPGNLSVTVTYLLTEDNELVIKYSAKTDKPTIINLTNHAFFNLNGEGDELIHNHILRILSDKFLPVDRHQIPTGEMRSVENSSFDFRTNQIIGTALQSEDEQLTSSGGFDHTYILNDNDANVAQVYLFSPKTGIALRINTTEPGIQLYTGNALSGTDVGKNGTNYTKHSAVCLETQNFPDAPNKLNFPESILRPGEKFHSETRYQFSVIKNQIVR